MIASHEYLNNAKEKVRYCTGIIEMSNAIVRDIRPDEILRLNSPKNILYHKDIKALIDTKLRVIESCLLVNTDLLEPDYIFFVKDGRILRIPSMVEIINPHMVLQNQIGFLNYLGLILLDGVAPTEVIILRSDVIDIYNTSYKNRE